MSQIDPENIGDPDDGSWYRTLRTERTYSLGNGDTCVVTQEYQRINCPHCEDHKIFVRHTYIVWHTASGTAGERHHNYRKTYCELLLVAITNSGIHEVEVNGSWSLQLNNQIIGNA